MDAYAGTKATATGNSREATIFSYAKDKVVPWRHVGEWIYDSIYFYPRH